MVISATIPVATAENERSFSCSYLHSGMNHERLGDFGTLSIDRERNSNIDLKDIVDVFASHSEMRIISNQIMIMV